MRRVRIDRRPGQNKVIEKRRTDLSPKSLIHKANNRIPMTHEEIGSLVGLGRARVQQIEAEALAKLIVPLSEYRTCEP